MIFQIMKNLPNEHVVGNIVQVATILQPWTSSRDVISGTFSFDFD